MERIDGIESSSVGPDAGFFDAPAPDTASPRPRRRALYAFGALSLGIVIGRLLPDASPHPVAMLAAACALLATAGLARGALCAAALFLSVVLLGAALFTVRIRSAPDDSLVHLRVREGDTLLVRGLAVDDPRPLLHASSALNARPESSPAFAFTLSVRSVGGESEESSRATPCSGRLRVVVRCEDGAAPAVRAGDRVRLLGSFEPVRGPTNPGQTDARLWAAQEGRVGTLVLGDPELARIDRKDSRHALAMDSVRAGWWSAAGVLRRRALGALGLDRELDSAQRPLGRALLAALLLGQREDGLDEINSAFSRLGLVHVLSISGFHLVVMAWLGLFALRTTGDHGAIEPLACAALVLAYLVVVPAEAPVLRSGLMVLVFLAAEAAGRRYDRVGVLAWIAFLLLLVRPMDLFSIGFQLSFGIVAALLLLGRRTHERFFPPPIRGVLPVRRSWPVVALRFLGVRAQELASSTLLAWAVGAPLVAQRVGVLSIGALPCTMVVLPMIIVLLVAGYAVLLVGVLFPSLGATLFGVLLVPSDWVARLALRLDDLPYLSLQLPRLSIAVSVAATAVIAAWFAAPRPSRVLGASTAALLVWIGAEVLTSTRLAHSVGARIDTFDVGDGTCHLVRSGGEAVLWDCGSLRSGMGGRVLTRALRAVGAWHVRTAVITHPNIDHFDSLLDVAGRVGLRRVLLTERFLRSARESPGSPAAMFIDALDARSIEVRSIGAGGAIGLSNATLRFVWPEADDPALADNDTSLVAVLEVPTAAGTVGALFTGDIQREAISALLAAGRLPAAAVLEAPHHGAFVEPAPELARTVGAKVVLQSTGPSRAADTRWNEVRGQVLWRCTATDGAIRTLIKASGEVESTPALDPS